MLGRTVDHKITRIKEFHDSSLMRGDRPECPLWVVCGLTISAIERPLLDFPDLTPSVYIKVRISYFL